MSAVSAKHPEKPRHCAMRQGHATLVPRINANATDRFVINFRRCCEAGDMDGVSRLLFRLSSLTPVRARAIAKLIDDELTVIMANVRSLDEESAAELSRCRGGIVLPGLAQLTPQVARALVKRSNRQCALCLDGLKQIDARTARVLAHGCDYLSLTGLQKIEERAARALARNEGFLSLGGARIADRRTLKAFAEGTKGRVYFNAARSRAKMRTSGSLRPGTISFGDLCTHDLTVERAASLVRIKKKLHFGSVYFLSPEVAKVLGRARFDLMLPSVCRLEGEALESLAKVPGLLDLTGLRSLPGDRSRWVGPLAARTGRLHLNRWCSMGRNSRMLLLATGHLQLAARKPAELPPARVDQLHNRKLDWQRREAVAKSICEDVFRQISGERSGPACRAPLRRWLRHKVDTGPGPRTVGMGERGASCWDVLYFLFWRKMSSKCRGDRVKEHYCELEWEKCVERALKRKTLQQVTRGGIGLFLFLHKMAVNAVSSGLKKYNKAQKRDRELTERLEEIEAITRTLRVGFTPREARERETEVMARAERTHDAAESALPKAGKGTIRQARKNRLDALLWLEWSREKEKWLESGAKGKLTQQRFVEIFNERHPTLRVGQPTLSRLIKKHRDEEKAEQRV